MLKQRLALAAFLLSPVLACADAAKDLHQLFDDAWQQSLAQSPLFATQLGHEEYADKIPNASLEAITAQNDSNQALLTKLNTINIDELNAQDQLSYRLFEHQLRQSIDGFALDDYVYAQGTQAGFLHGLMYLPRASQPFDTAKDYEDYLARLSALPTYLTQNTQLLEQGINTGRVQARISMAPIVALAKQLAMPALEENPLYKPFTVLPENLSEEQRAKLTEQAKTLFEETLLPALQDTRNFLEGPYSQAAAPRPGLLHQPKGDAYYKYLIAHHTTTDKSADEIHQIGQREVKRIQDEMRAIMKQVDFNGDLQAFITSLRQNPDFYAKTEDELLKQAMWIANKINGEVPALIGKLPRKPYTIAPVPAAIAPDYTAGRYLSGTRATQAGTYWVNTWDLPSRPLFGLPALTAHEAVPGHHLQIALSQELDGLPEFRQYIGFTAFTEGWALYAEYLGIAMGIYTTPYEHFGRLSFEMWRACRLVVDTGIHAMGWTRQQAIDFMAANTALSRKDIEVEVDRYISWPGQALGYKMGELTIKALRAEAEKTLGDNFDIRAFHDVVLDAGPVPLAVLEQRVNAWIAAQTES